MNLPPVHTSILPMAVEPSSIDGLAIISMKQVSDERGTVREFYRDSAFAEAKLVGFDSWSQINVTQTQQGAIRGLHGEDMSKLVAVIHGEAFGVYVDVRPDSRTRGNIVTAHLTKGTQVLVPRGVCNGFQSTSEGSTQYLYCFDAEWVPGMSGQSITPLDPELGVVWPIAVDPSNRAQISLKDLNSPKLSEVLANP